MRHRSRASIRSLCSAAASWSYARAATSWTRWNRKIIGPYGGAQARCRLLTRAQWQERAGGQGGKYRRRRYCRHSAAPGVDHCGRCSHRRCLVCGRNRRQRFVPSWDQICNGLAGTARAKPQPRCRRKPKWCSWMWAGDAVLICRTVRPALLMQAQGCPAEPCAGPAQLWRKPSWTCCLMTPPPCRPRAACGVVAEL